MKTKEKVIKKNTINLGQKQNKQFKKQNKKIKRKNMKKKKINIFAHL